MQLYFSKKKRKKTNKIKVDEFEFFNFNLLQKTPWVFEGINNVNIV